MEMVKYVVKSAPIPVVLHDGLFIIETSESFKELFSCQDCQNMEGGDLGLCLSNCFKAGKMLSVLVDGFRQKKEFHLDIVVYKKGTKTNWKIHSFPFAYADHKAPSRQVTWFIDESYQRVKNAYWELQINMNLAMLEITRREEKIRRGLENQNAINTMLYTSLENISLKETLEKILHQIFSISWLGLLPKGCIFVVEENPDILVMKAQSGLPEALLEKCKSVPFGQCLCGQAALSGKIVFTFTCDVDECHEPGFDNLSDHVHYGIPIISGNTTLGVLKLYVKEGHLSSEEEEKFLNIISSILTGIIKRKMAETKLAEATAAKEEFISMVSHELRTPMTALKESVSIILDGLVGEINADQREMLNMAKRNVDRLSRLINDILDFQKLDAGKMVFIRRQTDINRLISEVIKTMLTVATAKGLYLNTQLISDLPQIIIDPDKITQVLINLVNNAIKFTDTGGITVSAFRDNNSVVVSVKDTGPGIKKEDISKLFKAFSQIEPSRAKEKSGTGLGLSISKKIIQEHKGEIWIESELGKGSDFKFRLPVKTKYKILLVNDDKDVLPIYKQLLNQEGYEVTYSEGCLEAMEKIELDRPDLLVLDIRLGDINGYEIIRRLRCDKETSIIPILAMSGYTEELEKLKEAREDAALALISKPFQFDALLSKIRLLLKQAP